MKKQNKENKTERVKTKTIKTKGLALKLSDIPLLQTLISAYFSFAGLITKPLYIYYQSKLVDASQINEIETNLRKRRTEVFLTRR